MKTLSLLMLFILTSCMPSFSKSALNFDDGAISVMPLTPDEEAVTFEVLKEKLLVPHCLSCHKKYSEEDKLPAWVVPGKYEDSKLYQVIKNGSMPKKAAALDSRYLDLVIRYIESVKKPEGPAVITATAAAFDSIREKILVPHCISCHDTMTDEASLAPFITAEKPLESEFYKQVADGSMPMGSDPLSTKEVALVKDYIESLKVVSIKAFEASPFENMKEKILVPKCLSCHKKMGDEVNLGNWVTPRDPANSKMYKAVVSGSMPKKGDRLTTTEIKIIETYINSL